MKEQLAGILVVDKPAGISSRKVVDVVARAVKPAKAGHAGTLDPMATGVLVVCIGKATRLIGFVQERRKTYAAQFRLGETSDTDDATGNVETRTIDDPPTREEVEAALASFVGTIDQVPPQFSAVHVDGRRAYKLARRGEQVELKSRMVEVYRITLQRYEFPELNVEIECGSGTYIRSIGRDLGERLGCGGLMSELARTAIGTFRQEDAIPPDDIDAAAIATRLLPPIAAVGHLPRFECSPNQLRDISHGKRIPLGPLNAESASDTIVAVGPGGDLAALGEIVDDGQRFAPRQVFV